MVARDIYYADSFIFLNHFKGHEITGFGGALKNMGMGCEANQANMHASQFKTYSQGREM